MTYVLGKSATVETSHFATLFLWALLATLIFLYGRSWLYSGSIARIGFDLNHILAESTLLRNCAFFNRTPQATILGLFLKDIGVIDDSLPRFGEMFVFEMVKVIASVSLSILSLGIWIGVGFVTILYTVKFWVVRYCIVAVQLRKIQIRESAKMVGVFFNLLEGLSVIRCTRAASSNPNLPAGQHSAAIVAELMMRDQFLDNISKTNISWAHENFSKQWINIRIELSLAVLTGIIAFFIWLSKILE